MSLLESTYAEIPKCPICFDVIKEPVVYPCLHEICKGCFDSSVRTANLCCPLCRKRVSSWARRHAKNPVDVKRKKVIETKLQRHEADSEHRNSSSLPLLSQPGDIEKEYLSEIKKLRKEQEEEKQLGELEARRLQQEEEEAMLKLRAEYEHSERVAIELKTEESTKIFQERTQLQQDYELAKTLSQKFMREVGTTALDHQQIPKSSVIKQKSSHRKMTDVTKCKTVRPISLWMKKLPCESNSKPSSSTTLPATTAPL